MFDVLDEASLVLQVLAEEIFFSLSVLHAISEGSLVRLFVRAFEVLNVKANTMAVIVQPRTFVEGSVGKDHSSLPEF